MKITKRDKNLEEFDSKKIKLAIQKAFDACDYTVSEETINDIVNSISIWDGISVEDIQDQVEETLMDFDFPTVAKEYIIYRYKKDNLRDEVNKRLDFIQNYINSDNTANATIDDNSNVANRNIAVLNSEIHKPANRDTNFRMLRDMLKKLYPDFDYKLMDKDFNSIAYLHDSNSQIGMPYCVAITLYPFLLNGIKD